MALVAEVAPRLGIAPACQALGIPRSSFYRWRKPKAAVVRRPSHRALSEQERTQVLEVLREPRFVDQAPAEVYATLLDEERYLCSERTMYRILVANREVRERRNQLRHPQYPAPQLLATSPNEVWSWDITKLLGPVKWTYFYLYVILDIFSRFVVGWMVAHRELASLAQRLIAATCYRQRIQPGQLTIHADRGSSMTSKSVALLLADLGVTKTHSRPYVSNDNPYSESHFKTVKYRPEFPDRFGCIQHSRSICGDLFRWYNYEHRHGGLGMLTPYDVHYGLALEKLVRRRKVLARAYAAHPERFPHGHPKPADVPKEVWINKPSQETAEDPILTNPVNSRQTDARGCPRIDDLEVGIGRATPDLPTREPSEVIL